MRISLGSFPGVHMFSAALIATQTTPPPTTPEHACGAFAVACDVGKGIVDGAGVAVGGVAGAAAGGFLEKLVADTAGGVAEFLVYLATIWLRIPLPPLTGDGVSFDPPAVDPAVLTLASNLWWFGLVLGIGAILTVGIRLTLSWRNGSGEAAFGRLFWVAGGVLLLGVASNVVGYFLTVTSSPGAGQGIGFVQVVTFQWTAIMAIVSVMIGAIRTIWSQDGRNLASLGASLIRLLVVSTFSLAVVNVLAAAFDRLSIWVLEQATSCDLVEGQDGACLSEKVRIMVLGVQDLTTPYQGPTGLASLLALLVLVIISLAVMIQMMMMLVRAAIIILMVGFLPLASSFTNTEMGKKWFDSSVGWLLAALLYKPVSAVIIASGIWMTSALETSLKDTVVSTILGLTVIVLSVVAAPALLRLCVPAVSQVASSGSGGMMATAMVMSSVASLLGGGNKGGGPEGASPGGSSSPTMSSAQPGPVGATGGGSSGSRGTAGSSGAAASRGAAGSTGMSGAGAAAGAVGGGSAAGGGAAAAGAAGGPVGMAVSVGAQKVGEGIQQGAAVVNAAVDGSLGGEKQ